MKTFAKYAFEFILLFAAVTTSFWVENYREDKNEKETIKKRLEGLVKEYKIVKEYRYTHDARLIRLNTICSLVRNDRSFILNDSIYGFIAAQRYIIRSDFFDDFYKNISITELDDYRHIRNDSLTDILFYINDYANENIEFRKWAFDIDKRLVRVLQKYDLQSANYQGIEDSIGLVIKPLMSGLRSQKEKTDRWRAFTKDEEVQSLIAEVQTLHLDSYFTFLSTLLAFEPFVGTIEKEIEGL